MSNEHETPTPLDLLQRIDLHRLRDRGLVYEALFIEQACYLLRKQEEPVVAKQQVRTLTEALQQLSTAVAEYEYGDTAPLTFCRRCNFGYARPLQTLTAQSRTFRFLCPHCYAEVPPLVP